MSLKHPCSTSGCKNECGIMYYGPGQPAGFTQYCSECTKHSECRSTIEHLQWLLVELTGEPHPNESWAESSERIAEEFWRQTGLIRPGLSVPPEMSSPENDREREAAWKLWNERQNEDVLLRARAEIAKMPGYCGKNKQEQKLRNHVYSVTSDRAGIVQTLHVGSGRVSPTRMNLNNFFGSYARDKAAALRGIPGT